MTRTFRDGTVGNYPVPSRGVNCPWNVRSILLVEEPVCALEQYVPHSTKKRPNFRELRLAELLRTP